MKKVMILGVPTAGKTSILKLLDGDDRFNVAHTDDKVLDFFVTFDFKKLEKKINKFEAIYSSYTDSKQVTKLKINNNTEINYTIPLHLYVMNNFLSCHNLQTWSKLKCLPSEHSSKIKKNENFEFDYNKFENMFFENVFKNEELNSEKYLEIYYDAYFSSWKNDLNKNNKEFLIFQGPNDYKCAEYVLSENFDIKIIYIERDMYSRIISNSFRVQKINKKKKLSEIIISDMSNNYSKKRIMLLKRKIDELNLSFKNEIFQTSFSKITFNTEIEVKKICEWLGLEFKDIMCKPSLGGKLVDQNYINRSLDLENFNNNHNELKILLSFYCKKISTFQFLKNFNFILLKLYITYLFVKLSKFFRFKK
mgnify:CR=1 FL=1